MDKVAEMLNDLKESINLNIEDIQSDIETADELVTTDLLFMLNYNRRKDRTIKKLKHNDDRIWKIGIPEGNKKDSIIVKTISYNQPVNIEDCKELGESENCFLILFDIQRLHIISTTYDRVIKTIELDEIVDYYDKLSDRLALVEFILEAENEAKLNDEKEILKFINSNPEAEFVSTEFCDTNNLKIEDVHRALKRLIDNSFEEAIVKAEEFSSKDEISKLRTENTKLQNTLEEMSDKLRQLEIDNEAISRNADELSEELAKLKLSSTVTNKVEQETQETQESQEYDPFDDIETLESDKFKTVDLLDDSSNTTETNTTKTVEVVEETEAAEEVETDDMFEGSSNTTEANTTETAETTKTTETVETGKSYIEEMYDKCLNVIDDIEDSGTNTYIGVVNGTLFQTDNIEDFTATAIGELFAICGSRAMPKIYDGDIFSISPSESGKCIINSNKYTVNIEGLDDQTVLGKLEELFGYFSDAVVFMHKEYTNKFISVDTINDKYDGKSLSEVLNDKDDLSDIDISENEYNPFDLGDSNLKLTKMSLLEILDSIDRIPNGIDYSMIKAIGYKGKIFVVDSNNNSIFDNTLYKICCAIIGYSSQKYEMIATTLSKIEFTKISRAIEYINEETKYVGDGILRFAIPGTKYALRELDIRFFSPIINTLCELVEVNSKELEIYLKLECTDNDLIKAGIGTNKVSLNCELDKNYIYRSTDSDEIGRAAFSGNVMTLSFNDRLSSDIANNVILECKAIKSNGSVSCKINDEDDMAYVLTEILAASNSPIDNIINIVDSSIDIITNEYDANKIEIKLSGETYYLNHVTQSQYMMATMLIYGMALGNLSVGILTEVNLDALRYYSDFTTNDPVKYIEAKAMAEYTLSRVAQ